MNIYNSSFFNTCITRSKCPLLEKVKFYSKETTQFKFMIDAGLGANNPQQNLNQE